MKYILLFCLIIFSYASTEKEKMLKYFTYGISNSFDFYDNFETYILRGEVQSSYKSLDFNIYSSINITDIRYLYSNIEYNDVEDMNKDFFTNPNAKYSHYDMNHEFTFTARNSLSTKYLYLLISISPSPPTDISVYVKSTYNKDPVPDSGSSSSSSFTSIMQIVFFILLGIFLIVLFIGCIVCSLKRGGTVCEGIQVCCSVCEGIGQCLKAFN